MDEGKASRLQHLDDEIARLRQDLAHGEAYGDTGPRMQRMARSIAALLREREHLTGGTGPETGSQDVAMPDASDPASSHS